MNAVQPPSEVLGRKSACPSPDVLLAFHRAKLNATQKKEIGRHLRRCSACTRNSRFVAGVLNDEHCLIRGIEELLPLNKKSIGRARGFLAPVSRPRIPRFISAAAAVAGIAVSIFVIFSPGPYPPSGRRISSIAEFAGSPSARLFSKRVDNRPRAYGSGAIFDSGLNKRQYVSLEASNVLASFELSAIQDRGEKFYGWSLALYPAAVWPNRAILRR